jgi:hypothetical protein
MTDRFVQAASGEQRNDKNLYFLLRSHSLRMRADSIQGWD